MMDMPLLLSLVSLVTLWVAAQVGVYVHTKREKMTEDERQDLGVILGAGLTLLGLIIGFTFSMAISRYDQRKNDEANEANAIGTEYTRAGLLGAENAAIVRRLLSTYTGQRISFYTTKESGRLRQIDSSTLKLQSDLWSAIEGPAIAQPTPVMQLVVSGMNDVLNTQAYTQASWWNRIPIPAWILLAAIAIFCNYLVGYTSHRFGARSRTFFLMPLLVSIAFFLIADIDSPRGGVIRVRPINLESVASSMQPAP
jgi:hypothetical protein